LPHVRKHFAIAYLLLSIAVMIIDPLLQIFAKISIPDTAGVIELIPAIFYVRVKFAEQNDMLPASRALWKSSLELTLIATAISFVLTVALMLAFSGTGRMSEIDALIKKAPIGLFAGALIISIAFHTLLIRFIMPMAIRSRWKGLTR
jgi:hypothetical protein